MPKPSCRIQYNQYDYPLVLRHLISFQGCESRLLSPCLRISLLLIVLLMLRFDRGLLFLFASCLFFDSRKYPKIEGGLQKKVCQVMNEASLI